MAMRILALIVIFLAATFAWAVLSATLVVRTEQADSAVFPERLQPGQLAQRITMWAPLPLLFYFFVMFIITTLRRIDLHPMNYFFLAAAFFSLDRKSVV